MPPDETRSAPVSALEARPASAEEREAALYARLSALGIPWRTHAHAPVYTVEEARALRGNLPGTHTKNLFLEDRRGGLWLVVAREDLLVDLNALSKALNAPRFSFGKPERMIETLGIAPGAVTPFALMNDFGRHVSAVLDEGILGHEPVNFHPLRNDKTTSIAAADLLRFLDACGHAPRICALPERQP
jgi:Ala-tRNA(Pro) deacylase